MEYLLLIDENNNIISENKTAVLLDYLAQGENTLYLYATTVVAWRQRIVPVVQWIAKNQEENPEFKLKVKVVGENLNTFQQEFLRLNNIEEEKYPSSEKLFIINIINSGGLIYLNQVSQAQICEDRIESLK